MDGVGIVVFVLVFYNILAARSWSLNVLFGIRRCMEWCTQYVGFWLSPKLYHIPIIEEDSSREQKMRVVH